MDLNILWNIYQQVFLVVYPHSSKSFLEILCPQGIKVQYIMFPCRSKYIIQFLAKHFWKLSWGVGWKHDFLWRSVYSMQFLAPHLWYLMPHQWA